MRLLITGAGGMLGRDVAAEAARQGHAAVALDRAALDIADAGAVQAAVGAERPDVVVNCAAYTNVDAAESDEEGATRINGAGAGNVAAAAAAAGAHVIHISSDYVFSGDKGTPYAEPDEPGPRSAYGRSKLAGEQAVAAAAPRGHTIVRSSWLFGVHGACFPATILRLAAERDSLNVVDDQVGCPTYTGHLAQGLLELARDRVPGVVHLAGGGECSWYELARETVARAGVSCDVRPCATEEFPRPASRPAYSVLRSTRALEAPLLPPWQEGLAEYLAAR